MDFTLALEAIKAGATVSVPAMPGCTVFMGQDGNGAPAICMRSANGKLVTHWLPPALLSADWQPAPDAAKAQ